MKKILLIDGTPEFLEKFKEYLEVHGYKFYAADNGNVGVALAAETSSNLINCNTLTADMDGFEVLKLIRNSLKATEIPVVFTTSLSEKIDRVEVLNWVQTTTS